MTPRTLALGRLLSRLPKEQREQALSEPIMGGKRITIALTWNGRIPGEYTLVARKEPEGKILGEETFSDFTAPLRQAP